MYWFHVRDDGTIEGMTGGPEIKRIPEPPKGITYAEATDEKIAAWLALHRANVETEERKPEAQRIDTRVKADALEVAIGRA